NSPCLQVMQMLQVHITLIKYGDFTLLEPSAQLTRAAGFMFLGRIDNDKARQERLQVQAQMAFDGSLATAVLSPVHAISHQLNGSRVGQMNRSFKTIGVVFAPVFTSKAFVGLTKMFGHGPVEIFSHVSVPVPIAVRQTVPTGNFGSANFLQRTFA